MRTPSADGIEVMKAFCAMAVASPVSVVEVMKLTKKCDLSFTENSFNSAKELRPAFLYRNHSWFSCIGGMGKWVGKNLRILEYVPGIYLDFVKPKTIMQVKLNKRNSTKNEEFGEFQVGTC